MARTPFAKLERFEVAQSVGEATVTRHNGNLSIFSLISLRLSFGLFFPLCFPSAIFCP